MADRGGLGGERGGDFGDGSRGSGFSPDRNPGGEGDDPRRRRLGGGGFGGELPPELADLKLADGRTLGEVFKMFQRERRMSPADRRIMAEKLAQANRLGFSKTILGGRPPTAGKAGQRPKSGGTSGGGGLFNGNGPLSMAMQDLIRRRING